MLQLEQFINQNQLHILNSLKDGEEGECFVEIENKIKSVIETMPKTYETDGQGDDAIVHLHYFNAGCDWYITERDIGDEQLQAFGLVKIAFTELGYISIKELLKLNVELDFYWTPKTLGEIKNGIS